MPEPIESVVDTYIRAWTEPDAAVRASMIDACWAVDGRLVTETGEIRGRTALLAIMSSFSVRVVRIRLLSVIDTGRTTFRFRTIAELRDGTSAEAFDAGEIGTDGRISLILTFAGPLVDAPSR